MFNSDREQLPFSIGFVVSLIGHVIGFALFAGVFGASRADLLSKAEVFSVTIEGGEKLGGITQVPKDDKPKPKALPNAQEAAEEEKSEPVEKKIEEPTVVDEVAEKKKQEKLLEEKKLAEKKKLEEKKKEEEKKRAEEAKKKAEEEKVKKAQDKKKRDELLAKAIKGAASRYQGESASAGGEGFGAARLGGKGMGGGILASAEFIAYRDALERHIKEGWRWLPGVTRLTAQVMVEILPNGVVQNASIVASSGSSTFDESAVRAVMKASPVPVAPAHLYEQFRQVRITFDSEQ